MKNAVVRICINLGIFESVVKAGNDGISLEELIVSTGVDETILSTPPYDSSSLSSYVLYLAFYYTFADLLNLMVKPE